MTELLDGRHVPWHFVSGAAEPAVAVDPLVQQRIEERRAAAARTELPPPVTREHPAPVVVTVSIDEAELRQRTQLLARAGLTAGQIRAGIRRNLQELLVIRSQR